MKTAFSIYLLHISKRLSYIFLFFILAINLCAQDARPYQVIIESIGTLESTKDPKCHATASRLENFMFGTPLTAEAREYRIDLQKRIVSYLWSMASQEPDVEAITAAQVNKFTDKLINFFVKDNQWHLGLSDGTSIHISQRDYDHYASVAYSLRAILAIQQEDMLGDRIFTPLEKKAIDQMKLVVDIISIGLLKKADQQARLYNKYEITTEDLDFAWQLISKLPLYKDGSPKEFQSSNYELTVSVINQKISSYQQYNNLSQKIFLRNIQVYFAKVPWTKDSIQNLSLVTSFQDIMIEFTSKLLTDAHKMAMDDKSGLILHHHVRKSLMGLLPHTINNFEDVTFFNRLPRDESITIASYDLDAFRDSGVHWNYLGVAIRENYQALQYEPDPFAMELLVEGIAQMGVLLWRMAGQEANAADAATLAPEHVANAFLKMKALSRENKAVPDEEVIINSQPALSDNKGQTSGALFADVTVEANIDFEHRTSDWLNRKIRSYVHDSQKNEARLGIPPAFGGGGVAAEDINHDGHTDILLLGGHGIKLFQNNGNKTFTDITASSGIVWKRADGTYAEPRQPIITDLDNDGNKDIFISYVNDMHRIFKGRGDGTFIDFTIKANLGGQGQVGGPCTAFDYDKDGLIDIYIGYFGNYLKGELPTLKRHNDNGEANKLYRNLGNMTFELVPDSGLENTGWTQAVGHADINNDGWQDIIVGNDFGINGYYINNGDGTFAEKSRELGVDKPSYTMNIGFTDLNADDLPDFYISNIVVMEKDDKYTAPNEDTPMHFDPEVLAKMRVVEANDLFLSQKGENDQSYELSRSIGRGYSSTGWAWDADFFDYDNDGDDDLYCLNGMNQYSVYSAQNPYYQSPEGEAFDAVFAMSNEASNVFFENNNGFLQNRSSGSGLDLYHTSRSAAYLDYDNDGDLDVIINNYNGPAYLYENKSEEFQNNWIAIDLKIEAGDEIKTLVGTKVKIKTPDGKSIWRQVSSTTGYLSVHPSRVYAGLGQAANCEVEVIWPEGKSTKQQFQELNKVHEIYRSK